MGAVYKAEDTRLHVTVALKQTLVDSEQLSKAFNREAQLLASLRHPTIPRVSDHFVDEYGQFLVMEYIPGDDLGSILGSRTQPFALSDVLRWADQLLAALEYLHTSTPPIVHRDIKPQNLKLTSNNDVILLDFGLAKGSLHPTQTMSTDSIFGYTPHYAPIEQINGTGTDSRSDLYALAATLYHLLTGRVPIDAATRASASINGQPDPLIPVHQINPGVPEAVAAVIHRALAQRASQRPATAALMREALHKAERGIVDPYNPEEVVFVQEARGDNLAAATIGRSTIPLRGKHPPERRMVRPGARLLGILVVPLLLAGGWFGLATFRNASGEGVGVEGTTSPTAFVASAGTEVPAKMNGSLNIAVALFAPQNNNACTVTSDEAISLSRVVFRTLSDEMSTTIEQLKQNQLQGIALEDVQIRAPEATGFIDGTSEGQAQAAQQKAKELNADIVLYGSIECNTTPRETRVTPYFYLSDRKLQSFDQLEFSGAQTFGSIITSTGLPNSSSTHDALNRNLLLRLKALTQFLIGLDFFYAGRNADAATILAQASSIELNDNTFLKSMILSYQGATASRLGDFAGAQVFYEVALAANPDSITTEISLADALFYASRGDCGASADAEGLRDALKRLQSIEITGDTTYNTMLRGFVALELAQVLGCMNQAKITDTAGNSDHYTQTVQQYQEAITFLSEESTITRDHLAEAHAGLGLTYALAEKSQDSTRFAEEWIAAAQEFCTASTLSGFAARQAEFHHRLAYIHGQLGEYEQAEVERLQAIKIDPSTETVYANWHNLWRDAWSKTGTSKQATWTCSDANEARS
jgi:tetratricopeptide (TPR) repeat protein